MEHSDLKIADAIHRAVDAGMGKMLAQLRPSGVTAVTLYTPPVGAFVHIYCIVVCNTNLDQTDFGLYHDDDGTTFNTTTALHHLEPLAAFTSRTLSGSAQGFIQLVGGSLGCATSVSEKCTFTVYGKEYPV